MLYYFTEDTKAWEKMVNDFVKNHGFIADKEDGREYKSVKYACVVMFANNGKNEKYISLHLNVDDYSQFTVGYHLLLKSLYCTNNRHCLDSLLKAEHHEIIAYPYLQPTTLEGITFDGLRLNYNRAINGYQIRTGGFLDDNKTTDTQNKVMEKFKSDYGFVFSSLLPDSIVPSGFNEPDAFVLRKCYTSINFPDIEVISYTFNTHCVHGEALRYVSDYWIDIRRKTTTK